MDTNNLMLVECLYPKFIQTYLTLPWEIYQADFVHPLYMHAFGGIYVDLDTDSIISLEGIFELLTSTNSTSVAYLTQMGTDTLFVHSIPNAFMASTPAHPFWPHFLQLSQCYANLQWSSSNTIGLSAVVYWNKSWNRSFLDLAFGGEDWIVNSEVVDTFSFWEILALIVGDAIGYFSILISHVYHSVECSGIQNAHIGSERLEEGLPEPIANAMTSFRVIQHTAYHSTVYKRVFNLWMHR
jgi:hypothetical protein